jgi:hypothetical protein
MNETIGRWLAIGDVAEVFEVGLSRGETSQIDRSQAGGIPQGPPDSAVRGGSLNGAALQPRSVVGQRLG